MRRPATLSTSRFPDKWAARSAHALSVASAIRGHPMVGIGWAGGLRSRMANSCQWLWLLAFARRLGKGAEEGRGDKKGQPLCLSFGVAVSCLSRLKRSRWCSRQRTVNGLGRDW